MEQDKIKIYARCSPKGNIERFLETAHYREEIKETDIFLEEGYGDDYAYPHAREKPLIPLDENGSHLWKVENGELRETTAAEREAELAARPKPKPTETELLKAQLNAVTERNEFLEDCMAEMAMRVYQ